MASQKRVLLITPDPDRLELWRTQFEHSGWEVISASSSEAGKKKLKEMWCHVSVIDLQCERPDDPYDYSGAEIARAESGGTERVLWVSSVVEMALKPETIPVSPDSLTRERANRYLSATSGLRYIYQESKGIDRLIELAENLYRTRFNATLLLQPPIYGFLAELIEELPEYGQASYHEKADAIRELEDILRHIFCHEESAGSQKWQLYRRLAHIDDISFHNGSGILIVRPRTDITWGSPRIIRLGKKESIDAEIESITPDQPHRPPLSPWGNPIRLMRFGGMEYHGVPPQKGEVHTFLEYCQDKTPADARTRPGVIVLPDIVPTIASFFQYWWPGKSNWLDPANDEHRQRTSSKEVPFDNIEKTIESLKRDVGLASPEGWGALQQSVSDILANKHISGLTFKTSRNDIRISFDGRSQDVYPHPIKFVESAQRDGSIPLPSLWCLSTGILSGHQILVNRDGKVWMVDLSNARWAPLWRDFTALESIIKFELVTDNRPQVLFEWEKALLTPNSLSKEIPDPDLSNVLSGSLRSQLEQEFDLVRNAVHEVRNLAQKVAPGADDMKEYYSVLLFHTLYRIMPPKDPWMYEDSTTQLFRQCHALMSAAMICRKLKEWGGSEPSERQLL